jgi:hypothetical protein
VCWRGCVAHFSIKGFFGGYVPSLPSVFFSFYALHSCRFMRVLGDCGVVCVRLRVGEVFVAGGSGCFCVLVCFGFVVGGVQDVGVV